MFPDHVPNHVHDIQELSPDDRILCAQKYRKYLHHTAEAAIWITYIYFAVRLFFVVTTPEQTWKIWGMLGVEGLLARKFLSNQR